MSDQPSLEAENEIPPAEVEITPRRAGVAVNIPALIGVMALILAAVGLILLNLEALPTPILIWWPLAILIPAVLWALYSLIRLKPRGLLRSTALIGVGGSLLMAAQGIAPLGATLVGVTFLAIGAGLILRGLIMANQPI